jgi:uncharacterized membrane protein YccC
MTKVAFGWARPFDWRAAVLCFPAMPVLLAAGLLTGDIARGVVAATAAFFVGLGLPRPLRGHPWSALLANALAITAAAFVGTLAGERLWLLAACASAMAATCAVSGLVDEGWWWVTLQALTALLAAGFFPGAYDLAATRATSVLAGGLVQALFVIVLATSFATLELPAAPNSPRPAHPAATRSVFACQAAACVVLSLVVAHACGFGQGYWAPMTAMLVIKPDLEGTRTRGFARLVGTVAGCAGATAYALLVGSRPISLAAALALTAGSAFAVLRAHYATWTAAVTATMVLLMSLGSGDAGITSEHRLLATMIGGASALLMSWMLSTRRLARIGLVDRRPGWSPEVTPALRRLPDG